MHYRVAEANIFHSLPIDMISEFKVKSIKMLANFKLTSSFQQLRKEMYEKNQLKSEIYYATAVREKWNGHPGVKFKRSLSLSLAFPRRMASVVVCLILIGRKCATKAEFDNNEDDYDSYLDEHGDLEVKAAVQVLPVYEVELIS